MHDEENDRNSLARLWEIANQDTGQSRIVARFLLNLFNGFDFDFDLTAFRSLDTPLFEDCMTVLRYENSPSGFRGEVHKRLGLSVAQFFNLQNTWNFRLRRQHAINPTNE